MQPIPKQTFAPDLLITNQITTQTIEKALISNAVAIINGVFPLSMCSTKIRGEKLRVEVVFSQWLVSEM